MAIVIYSSSFGVNSKAEKIFADVGVMVNHIPKILKYLLRRTEKANVKLELEMANFKQFFLLHIPEK